MLSSGANVTIWDEMLLSGANVIIWDKMLSCGGNVVMLSYGANVIIWCYHVMLSSGIITPPFLFFLKTSLTPAELQIGQIGTQIFGGFSLAEVLLPIGLALS